MDVYPCIDSGWYRVAQAMPMVGLVTNVRMAAQNAILVPLTGSFAVGFLKPEYRTLYGGAYWTYVNYMTTGLLVITVCHFFYHGASMAAVLEEYGFIDS